MCPFYCTYTVDYVVLLYDMLRGVGAPLGWDRDMVSLWRPWDAGHPWVLGPRRREGAAAAGQQAQLHAALGAG